MHRHAVALVASTVLLFAGHAFATPRVTLHWDAALGCLDAASLARTVESTLEQPIFQGRAAPAATLEGSVVKTPDGYRASIVLRSAAGNLLAEREISTPSDDCSRMDESLAVVVAMMVDGVPEPTPAPRPLHVPAAPPRHPARVSAPLVGEIEAGGAASIGLLPDVSPGAFVRASAGVGRWSVALAGYGWAPSDAMVLGSGARISAWAGEVSGCGALLEGKRGSLRACIAIGAGFTDATPIALQGGTETRLPLVFDAVAVDGALHLAGSIFLHLRAAVWNPLVVPTYHFYAADGSLQSLGSPWVLEPTFSVGLSARFGS